MLESLFSPKSVAVIGASRTPGKVGHELLANLIAGGYAGRIFPVNPAAGVILGLPAHARVEEIGEAFELGIIAVPAVGIIEAVRSALSAGARALVIVSAGFKESGEEGAALEREVIRLCHSKNVRLLGPNCLGLINTAHRFNASFAGAMPTCGAISVVSQSGALCAVILDQAATRHLGLAKVISIGNKADLTEVDFLHVLADDEQTKVVIGYLEDISQGDAFVKAAEEISSRKPVIIFKAGTTLAGFKAAASHTGILSGIDTAYGAAFKRGGIIRADTFESLFDYAAAFALQPLPKGNRVLIIANAGGPGTMAADSLEKAGMQAATVAENMVTALRGKLPDRAISNNNSSPVQILGDAEPEHYVAALLAAQENKEVDAILVLLVPQAMSKPAETALAIAANLQGDKPVVAAFMGGESVMPCRRQLAAAGLPDYPTPERAVAALKAMWEYAEWKMRPPRMVTRFRVNRRRVERIISRRLRTGRLQLGEVKAKDILRAYGFRIPDGSLATTALEAKEIAQRLGYPVAMKVVSPDIVHKSDLGGVSLNLTNNQTVEDAFDLMMLRIKQRAPDANIQGVYVEQMLDSGLEVIIGMNRDKQFGPMLMFGLGGIFVEIMKDVTFHLAPITQSEAIQMLMSTRSYEILQGKRGRKGVDLEAIAIGLQRISQLTTDFPQIAELDISPFIVGDPGMEPVVADARITLRLTE